MSSFLYVTRLTDVSELDETKRGHLNSLLRKVLNQYKCFAKGKFKSVSGARVTFLWSSVSWPSERFVQIRAITMTTLWRKANDLYWTFSEHNIVGCWIYSGCFRSFYSAPEIQLCKMLWLLSRDNLQREQQLTNKCSLRKHLLDSLGFNVYPFWKFETHSLINHCVCSYLTHDTLFMLHRKWTALPEKWKTVRQLWWSSAMFN